MVEDNPADFELLERELRRGGIRFVSRCVQTREDFLRELDGLKPDLVISDFALPQFDGLTALILCRERNPELPFIFVSGTVGEEVAVETLKKGATDYLLKGHTRRLSQAVLRAIQEARERREKRNLEAQLAQSQKMEAIGQLAGGIAHDFNNLLTGVLGYVDLALKKLPEKDPVAEDLRQIRSAGQRATELTRQLLAFSRKQIIAPRVMCLNDIVRDSEKLLRRLIGEDVELTALLDSGLWNVKTDRSQIEQVVMNLVVNARDAMPHGGKVTIETANVHLDEAYTQTHAGVATGPYVMIAVSDTGSGMDKATLARLFEPFFTTKEQGKGTGLGLATAYGIVRQSGGHIWVYSEPGQGATFKVYLPRVSDSVEAAPRPASGAAAAGGTEVILVVEDDAMVRKLVCHVLRRHGYVVHEAENGVEALRLCEQLTGPLHLVVTDVIMPRMGGREVAQRLRQLRPDLKILFSSGYTSNAIVHHGVLERGLAFLPKPFTPESLARKVRAVLDGRDETT